MKISEIHIYQIDLPVKSGLYVMGGLTIPTLDSTVVELITDTGLKGYGETCPLGATYQPEHALGARAALAQMAPHLIGEDPLLINCIRHRMDAHLNGHNYAKSAIDIALWDLAGKHYGARVCDLLGGAVRERIPSYCATGIDTPDETARLATDKVKQGYQRIQVKAGGRAAELDIETLRKVWEAVGTDAKLVADANRNWTTRDALLVSRACSDIPLTLEQPCNTMAEIAAIRAQLCHPVFLDECTTDLNSISSAIVSGLCDGFGFKLGRLGGLSTLRTARDICHAWSKPHTCDDTWGGDITAAACAHIGATVDPRMSEGVWIGDSYIDGHYDPENGIVDKGGHITLPQGPGLGIMPLPEVLGAAIATYG